MALLSRASPCMAAGSSKQTCGVLKGRMSVPLQHRAARSARLLCRAEDNQESGTAPSPPQAPTATEPRPQQPSTPAPQDKAQQPQAPLLAPGQGTAIVTGAVSVLFGVAYLALVQFMDMRGGELQPPPPEAFIP